MAEEFFAVWDMGNVANDTPSRKGGKEGEILNGPTTSPVWPGGLRTTRTVRLNAENVADVQKAVLEIYGARGTVYATKVASFKES